MDAGRLLELPWFGRFLSAACECCQILCAPALPTAQSCRGHMRARDARAHCCQSCVFSMIECGTGSRSVVLSCAFVFVDCWCTYVSSQCRLRVVM